MGSLLRIAAFALVVFTVGVVSADAEPCTTATAACTEWVHVGTRADRSLVYRTHALDTTNDSVTRALVVVHGVRRNADRYFRTGVASAFRADALADTVVIAPRFASNDGQDCRDSLAADEINWSCPVDGWRSGGASRTEASLTTFDLMDALLRMLAAKRAFPHLNAIVVAGHSAGGQYVGRYAMANRALLGELDTLPLANFDASCPAMAQGGSRLARGQAFHAYVHRRYGADHGLIVVPLCGHNDRCMFTAERALPLLFPKP